MKNHDSPDLRRRLMWHGIFLFLLGLLTGFIIPSLTNPRMGVSAHLNGVMSGSFLAIIGLLWKELRWTPKTAAATFWIALFGTYVNWAFTLVGGILGTSRLTPIAGTGFSGSSWQETFIAVGLVPMTISMVICCVLVLRGLGGSLSAE
jgi:(hydroxyamino)benzene mutase